MKRKPAKKNRWEDHYTRRAKKEQYPARSVYKLQEIQKKRRIIRPGDRVLDLGCAPGSWLKYAGEQVGAKGLVIGIDLKPVKESLPANIRAYAGDIFALDEVLGDELANGFDVVLSDMAPATTGHKWTDSARSFELCRAALAVAGERLRPGGNFVCKIFQGEDFQSFSNAVKKMFNTHAIFKPQSSRKASKEIFIIGMGKKQEETDVRTQ